MTNQPSAPALDRAFPWLSAALLVSAGAAWLVGWIPDPGRITLDVTALLLAGLVVLVIAIDAVIARFGAPVAGVLLGVYAAAVGVVTSCLAAVAGIGTAWPVFVVAAAIVAAVAALRVVAGRPVERGAPMAALVLYLGPVNAVLRFVRGVDRFVGDSREDPGWNARHRISPERRARSR